MNNKEKPLKIYKFEEIKNEFIGKKGTPKRDKYENELSRELLGEMIKRTRIERKLTQEALGKSVGVKKAQISKIESGKINVTVDTITKVFEALKATVNFKVELQDKIFGIAYNK